MWDGLTEAARDLVEDLRGLLGDAEAEIRIGGDDPGVDIMTGTERERWALYALLFAAGWLIGGR